MPITNGVLQRWISKKPFRRPNLGFRNATFCKMRSHSEKSALTQRRRSVGEGPKNVLNRLGTRTAAGGHQHDLGAPRRASAAPLRVVFENHALFSKFCGFQIFIYAATRVVYFVFITSLCGRFGVQNQFLFRTRIFFLCMIFLELQSVKSHIGSSPRDR